MEEASEESLWGARQTGRSILLKTLFPDAPYYDLLKSNTPVEYAAFAIA